MVFGRFRKQKGADDLAIADELDGENVPEVMDVDYDPEDFLKVDDLQLDDLDEDGPRSLEGLDIPRYWNRRLNNFQEEFDNELWQTMVTGRTDEKKTGKLAYYKLITKGRQLYVDLRCSLVPVDQAKEIALQCILELKDLQVAVGFMDYPVILLGMIQACIFEQNQGFHVPSFSEWDLNIENTDDEYARRLIDYHSGRKELEVRSAKWKEGMKE